MSGTAAAGIIGVGRRVPLRVAVAGVLAAGAAAGWLATPGAQVQEAVALAGDELVRLLRMMAVVKLALVLGAAGLVGWRLRFPTPAALAAGYLAGLAAAAAGPGLIWQMAHVAAGAAALHGGLALVLVLLWRDPGSPAMLRRHAKAEG